MSRLRGCEITRMRAAAYLLMPTHVDVYRQSYASDSHGGMTTTSARVWSGPGRFSPVSTIASADVVGGETAGEARQHVLTLPIDADVRIDDRVVIAGRTFEVESTDGGRSYAILRRLQLVEVT